MPLESSISKRAQRAVRDNWPDAFVMKNHGDEASVAGLPDILVIRCGRPMFFEMKQPGEKPSVKQAYIAHVLARAGASVALCDNSARVVDIVDKLGLDAIEQETELSEFARLSGYGAGRE